MSKLPGANLVTGKYLGLLQIALLLLTVSFAEAQQPKKVQRIGFLDSSTASGMAVLVDVFRQELGKLGWIEGQNLTIDYRFGENLGVDRIRELAAELVRLKVDLIVVVSTTAALEAKRTTTTIPIVMTNAGDPVAAGLVEQSQKDVVRWLSWSFFHKYA